MCCCEDRESFEKNETPIRFFQAYGEGLSDLSFFQLSALYAKGSVSMFHTARRGVFARMYSANPCGLARGTRPIGRPVKAYG